MRKKWLNNEDKFLVENYSYGDIDEMTNTLNRSWISIQHRAKKLLLKRKQTKIRGKNVLIWDEVEIKYLQDNYPNLEKQKIINHLNRGWSSIQNKAFLLNIKRDIRNSNSYKLKNGTNESYYWLGFIMADGHFNNKTKQIQINLSEKDLSHLIKLSIYLVYKKKITSPSISINYTDINDWLIETFNIKSDKTYNPCSLNKLYDDNLFSFIIGFIDGDGSIDKKGYLRIKCHKSWLDNLNYMVSYLSNNEVNRGYINSEGLAFISITKIEIMKKIKQKIIELNLPMLDRKWDRVKMSKLSKKEINSKNTSICYGLFDKGKSINDVISLTNLSKSQVYKQKRNYDIDRDIKRNI